VAITTENWSHSIINYVPGAPGIRVFFCVRILKNTEDTFSWLLAVNLAVVALGIEKFYCIEFSPIQSEGVFSYKTEARHILRPSKKIAQKSLFIAVQWGKLK
jgi:hypothetical protein